MRFFRWFQLCAALYGVIFFYRCPPRRPVGDIRNFARSFFWSYYFHQGKLLKEQP